MKPIQVFVRQCFYSPNTVLPNRKRPKWFDKEKIFNNFQGTINGRLADYTVVYDEHYGKIDKTFLRKESRVEIIDSGCEAGSFLKTLEIVENRKMRDDTVVYLLEDDYLHREGWCEALLEALTLPVHYVSLYDHLDKYTDKGYSNLVSKIFTTQSSHWRTVPSTCNSYAAKMGQLRMDMPIHKHYSVASSDGISLDHAKFVHLGNPLRGYKRLRRFAGRVYSCGLEGLGNFQGGYLEVDEPRILITPMPGYSTHCDLFQSPAVDWEKYVPK